MRERDGSADRRSVLRAMGGGLALPAGLGTADLPDALADPASGDGGTDAGLAMAAARTQFHSQRAVAGKVECFRPNQREIYGPTDINAQTGNGRLSVGINREGTLTVLRWPYPSYYDQLKYYTLGRDDADRIEVLPNEGSFLGLLIDGETSWLRDWDATQRYAADGEEADADFSDEVVTVYRPPDGGPPDRDRPLRVVVRDVVAPDADVLVRRVRIVWPQGPPDGTDPQLVTFANVNPVVSKHPQYPIQDWCTEENNQGRTRYLSDADAIVADLTGVDESTGQPQRVAVAMGTANRSSAHQVGGDAHEPAAEPTGHAGPTRDAYDAASAGAFPGNDQYVGQTTGALATPLTFQRSVATGTVVLAAGHTPTAATDTLDEALDRQFEEVRAAKESWLASVLAGAPMPDTDDEALRALCRRALVTLVTDTEDHPAPATATRQNNRAIVASIATQAPYGEDWIRDGAYFNRALEVAGLGGGDRDWVADRNRWYAEIQQRADDPRPSHPNTPPGNWVMNYYGDGVAGGPIPYEIDETGYGIWTLWSHAARVGDDDRAAYLADVYPAISRAADFLVECRDPETDLHCPTWEDDRFQPQRATIVGASLVWLGLESAAAAARAPESPGTEADATRYETRQHEVGRAIDRHLYGDITGEGDVGYGVRIGFPMAEVGWPVGFTPYADPESGAIQDRPVYPDDPFAHPRIQSHLDAVWNSISPAFDAPNGPETTGQYEVKGLIPLALADRDDDQPGSPGDVERGIRWLATEHATDDTHIMGEAWKVFEGTDGEPEVRSIISQPHAWEQVLVYLAALEAHGPAQLATD